MLTLLATWTGTPLTGVAPIVAITGTGTIGALSSEQRPVVLAVVAPTETRLPEDLGALAGPQLSQDPLQGGLEVLVAVAPTEPRPPGARGKPKDLREALGVPAEPRRRVLVVAPTETRPNPKPRQSAVGRPELLAGRPSAREPGAARRPIIDCVSKVDKQPWTTKGSADAPWRPILLRREQ